MYVVYGKVKRNPIGYFITIQQAKTYMRLIGFDKVYLKYER